MPKIIAVQGVSNTGKSTAIVAAMNLLGLHVGGGGKDVLASAFLSLQGRGYGVGFASGGDTWSAVDTAVTFFQTLTLDYIVFACRTYGGSYNRLTNYAAQIGVAPNFIPAQRVPLSGIAANHQSLVQAILGHIP